MMGEDLHSHWVLNAALTPSGDNQAATSLPGVAFGVTAGQWCDVTVQYDQTIGKVQ